MKKIIIYVLLFQSISFAGSNDLAGTILLVFGTSKAMQYSLESGFWPDELNDWKDPNTQITAQINAQCGMLMEGRLLGANRNNNLVLMVKSEGDEFKFRPGDVEFEFGDGLVRRADVDLNQEQTFIKGTRYIIFLPFPRKRDFKNQTKLTVRAEFESKGKKCKSEMTFNRTPGMPDTPETYTRMTSAEVDVAGGISSTTGMLGQIIPSGLSYYLVNLNFIGQKHGMYIDFSGTSSITADNKYAQAVSFTANSIEANIFSTDLGYAYRKIISEKNFYTYKIGLSSFSIILSEGGYKQNQTEVRSFAFNQQIMFSHFFLQIERGFWAGDYAIVAGINHHWIPNSSIGPYDYSGNLVGAFVGIKIGD